MKPYTRMLLRIVLLALLTGSPAFAGVPQSTGYLYWGPHEYSLNSGLANDAAWDEISQISTYIKFERSEATDPNGTPSQCTLDDLKSRLQAGKGIVIYAAHGGAGSIDWAAIDTFGEVSEQVIQDALDAYEAADSSLVDKLVGSSFLRGGTDTHRFIKVHKSVTTDWADDFYATRHGVSFTFSCGTYGQGYNCFWSECSFGYKSSLYCPQAADDITGIFERMNGSVGNGMYRTAAQAHANYNDPSEPIVYLFPESGVGVGSTELCPVPDGCPSNGYIHDKLEGDGKVSFSAPMDTTMSATSIVSISGGSWQTNGAPTWTNSSVITFDWKRTTPGWVTITVSGSATADTKAGTLKLDGNGGTIGAPVGVAPNGDSYKYRFYANN